MMNQTETVTFAFKNAKLMQDAERLNAGHPTVVGGRLELVRIGTWLHILVDGLIKPAE